MWRLLSVVAVLAIPACSGAASAPVPPPRLELADCEVQGYAGPARCGTFEVWEDRRSRTGRRIPLNVVVLPALGTSRQPDPVFYFDGGPGSSATGAAGWVARLLRPAHESRDLVFVDVRGTGRSGALTCDLPGPDEPLQAYFDEFLSEKYVRACLARQQADVRFYTQPLAMDDIDDVRAALGYDRINLFGTSGGTRQAQLYMRRHGSSVRSAVLHGVAPMDGEFPLSVSRAMEEGVRALVAQCAGDAGWAAAHPRLADAWERSKRRFDAGPVRARVRHPQTGRDEDVVISRGVYADGVRHMLYNLQAARALPARIEAAADGDFDAFAQAELDQVIRFGQTIAHGFFLSSTCAEDIRFIDEEDIRRATGGTFLGDYRVRRQQAACRIWPKGAGVDAGFQQPVTGDLPVLLISGDADVATPASDGERVARHLRNARHVVFPRQGHTLRDPACASQLIAAFLASADAKGLDAACAAAPGS